MFAKCNYNSLLAVKSYLQLDISHDCNCSLYFVIYCTENCFKEVVDLKTSE